ncbi:hypothetical protein Dimus_025293 [Dionaea muscipula]
MASKCYSMRSEPSSLLELRFELVGDYLQFVQKYNDQQLVVEVWTSAISWTDVSENRILGLIDIVSEALKCDLMEEDNQAAWAEGDARSYIKIISCYSRDVSLSRLSVRFASHLTLNLNYHARMKEMSRTQDPHRPSFSFGNPFKMMLHRGSYLSPKYLALLHKFEETLAARIRKLKPKDSSDVLSLSFMVMCLQLLSETHNDIKSFASDLELPVGGWDNKWIDVYLDNSVKLLDISIAFISEISRLSQGQLLLQCSLHNLHGSNSMEPQKACSSLDCWRQHISSRNPRIENCCFVIDELVELLHLPKVKNSEKGKILVRAFYGVKMQTLFVWSIFTAAFTGSAKTLVDLPVPEEHLWAGAFMDLQGFVNGEIRHLVGSGRSILVKELEAVEEGAKNLFAILQSGVEDTESEALRSTVTALEARTEGLSLGLDRLAKEADGFFQIVLTGRDALLSNLRLGANFSKSFPQYKVELLVR